MRRTAKQLQLQLKSPQGDFVQSLQRLQPPVVALPCSHKPPELATTMADRALKDQIRADLNAARKERDRLRTTVLTTFLSEVRNREIELGREVGDEEVQALITTALKRRREAAEQMRAGGREELAAKEEQEAAMLQSYLPPQLGEEEVRAMIREALAAGAHDVGAVMKAVVPRTRGRFEGREVNRLAREELG